MKPVIILSSLLAWLAAAWMAACGPAAPSGMTVKYTETACTYEGPSSIPYGKFSVTMQVDDRVHNKAALGIFTLKPGKTLADVQASPFSTEPDWINGFWVDEANAFGAELQQTRRYVHEHDLATQANYNGEPLYMICGNEKGKQGAIGPIAVTK